MLPTFAVAFIVVGLIGWLVLMPLLGLNEGGLLLMAGGVAGWTAEIVSDLLVAAPAVAGAWFAVAALRSGGRLGAWAGLALNALLVALVIYTFVDAIHMTYYPGDWLWF